MVFCFMGWVYKQVNFSYPLSAKGGGCSIILLTEESLLQYSSTLCTSWMVHVLYVLCRLHTLAQLSHSKCLFDLLSGWGGGKVPLWAGRKANADRLLCSHQPVAVLAILNFFFFFFFEYSLTKKVPIRYCLMMINITPVTRLSCDDWQLWCLCQGGAMFFTIAKRQGLSGARSTWIFGRD